MPVLVAEVNKSMSHIKTNGGSFPLPCQHLKTIQTAQMDKWFMLTRTKIGYAPFETFTEANLQRFATWAKDEGHEMGCIYHLANFNRPNDQEAQAWSSHNISDLPSEEMSDSEQTNQTSVISLGRTALGSLLQAFQKHTVSISDIDMREIKLIWLSYPLCTALENIWVI